MNLMEWLERRGRALFGRTRREAELDEEMRFHLESAEAAYRAHGMSEEEARRAARLDFGGVERAKEEFRDGWALASLAAFTRDVRLAMRGFLKHPAYAATVVITIALAVGAAGAVFGALFAIVLRPLPFEQDERLVEIRQVARGAANSVGFSPAEIADYRQATRALEGVAEYHNMDFTLLGHGEPRRVRVGVVSTEYFRLLGVQPMIGRDFTPEDDSHAATPVLLLTHRFWRGELGADPSMLGADFTMNDRVHTVVGILPPFPGLPDELDVYMPVHACPFRTGANWADSRTSRGLTAIARLRGGFDASAAASDLETIATRLASDHPAAYPPTQGLRPRLVPLREAVTVGARPTLWLLVGAVTAVLLLVVANLLNLSLAQLARRQGELAMRIALGASRAQIARPLATEGCLLALTGGALGLLFSAACQGLLAGFLGRLTPRASEIGLDATTVLVVLGLSLAVGLLIGLVPALRRPADLSAALLSDGAKATAGKRVLRLRDGLVVVQVAASFVLLIGAGLLLESLWNLERVEPGFTHTDVITMGLPHNWTKYAKDEDLAAYGNRLLQAVQTVPGVRSAALSDNYPLNADLPWNRRLAIGTVAPDPASEGPAADFRTVSPDYFATIGVGLVAGRGLTDADKDPERAVVLVNEALVNKLFPDRDPLGQSVIFSRGNTSWTIVGVVADVRQRGLAVPAQPEVYAPLALTAGGGRLLVRAAHASTLVPTLRRVIRSIDPDQPITDVRTLDEVRAESLAAPRATAALLAIAAGLALAIAVAGLAGLLAYSLSGRQREFGIRMALGATKPAVARLVLQRTGGLVAIGVVLGLAGARLTASGLDSMLFGLSAGDPSTYLVVGAVLVTAAFLACVPSVRRAIGTDPSISLRAL